MKQLTLAGIMKEFCFNNMVYPLKLRGRPVANCIKSGLKSRISDATAQGHRRPNLAIILATDNPASVTYVGKKVAECSEIGMITKVYMEQASEDALRNRINFLNESPEVDGIILQLPVPGVDHRRLLQIISPKKDVDGLHPSNAGLLAMGQPSLIPCTPLGIYVMLCAYKVDLSAKHVAIVGKSQTVGSPMAALCSHFGQSTVSLIDVTSKNEVSISIRRAAEIQIIAAGSPKRFSACRNGSILVDVGINQIVDPVTSQRRLVGDIDHEIVKPQCSAITPVPGGVGPMTVSMVALNTFLSHQARTLGADIQELTNDFLQKEDAEQMKLPANPFRFKILLISSANNGMTQLIHQTLLNEGYRVQLHVTSNEEAMVKDYEAAKPDLIIAPMLKEKIPERIYKKTKTWIVHPGVEGDRGPSSIDWAILEAKPIWGVTVLEADEEMDAGDIWATEQYAIPLSGMSKSEMYNAMATGAARHAVMCALQKWHRKEKPRALNYNNPSVLGKLKPLMKQADRAIDWKTDSSADVIRKVRASDGFPGVLSNLEVGKYYLYDVHNEMTPTNGEPGDLLATRNGAVQIKTTDGSVWIGHMRKPGKGNFKLPASYALPADLATSLATTDSGIWRHSATYQDVHYSEEGDVGTVTFDFYNGAMRIDQCHRLCKCIKFAKNRPTKVILIKNDRFLFSNGINLNTIEAATDQGQHAWESINAIDDVVFSILSAVDHVTICVMGGNAGAGGVPLARAADIVVCPTDSTLNPHYKNMGLYGSEYWTFILPFTIGTDLAHEITEKCQPMDVEQASDIGIVDFCVPRQNMQTAVASLVRNQLKQHKDHTAYKKERFLKKEADYPLEIHRECELKLMHANIFGNNLGFAEKRYNFVHKIK